MGYVYILITTLLFSTMEIALKISAGSFNPIQLTFSRFLLGSLILMPFAIAALRKKQKKLTMRDFWHFAILGFVCVVVGMVFYQFALLYTKASVVAVLFSCNPIFVILFARVYLHEYILKHHIISVLFQILGIIMIIDPLHMELNTLGVVFSLLSAGAFALYGVLGRRKVRALSGSVVTGFSFLFGSLELLILALLTRIPAVSEFLNSVGLSVFTNVPIMHHYTAKEFWEFVYISVCVTGGGYYYYFKSMEKTSAATASLTFYFKPVLAPLLAMLILHEHIPWNMILGIVSVIVGSSISLIPTIRRERHMRQLARDTQNSISKQTGETQKQ